MASKMLIDSSHPEETRVVVTRGNKIEEFDFESATRRQLRGNIYLAKVTRVEPSLQAAFIEYGGNRHGFLAFSEIHPDYYQIPVADRQALLEADEREERDAEHEAEERSRGGGREGGREGSGGRDGGRRRRGSERRRRGSGETVSSGRDDHAARDPEEGGEPEGSDVAASQHEDEAGFGGIEAGAAAFGAPEPLDAPAEADGSPSLAADAPAAEDEPAGAEFGPEPLSEEPASPETGSGADEILAQDEDEHTHGYEQRGPAQEADPVEGQDDGEEDEDEDEPEEHEVVEQVGGGDAFEEAHERRRTYRRQYKIQEVIKRRQILLIQVVKEERGNKGAALTTYLSLAGRYSVLMPNTGKGGGISRKITSAEDRKRLKEIVQELEVPDGMGIILRTAGASRTKPEIKRDFEYLMRLWESVRELTLKSSAPALVYEEGSLIKRAIRDLYHKEIEEVVVAGEEGYREAKDFMRMIMPAQSKAVRPYVEPQALFASFGIEAQLDAMFSNHVTLKSGGYLVINPTEALVSIDVNSGRSTREHNIEDTALRTNMEASEEIARQLRLRDLAGLIVIDFIDMEERRNNRSVEKKLKDCLKNDRARIQVGRISPFGLLEMSRQRIRTGVLESSSIPCATCGGTGFVRSTPSVALQILRSIEESLLRAATHNVVIRTRTVIAFYILNHKRANLAEIEARFGVSLLISADETLPAGTTFALDRGAPATPVARPALGTNVRVDSITPVDEPIEIEPTEEFERDEEDAAEVELRGDREPREARAEPSEEEGEDGGRRKRRRRRRRGRGPGGREAAEGEAGSAGDEDESESEEGELNGAEVLAEPGGHPPEGFPAPVPEEDEIVARTPRYTDGPSPMAHPIGADDGRPPEPPNALTDIGAEVASTPREPEEEPVAVVLTAPDPDRPKRGGWWSKAKSALTGS